MNNAVTVAVALRILLACLPTYYLRDASFVRTIMGGFFSKSFNPEKDVPDLSGKVIIVTGGK